MLISILTIVFLFVIIYFIVKKTKKVVTTTTTTNFETFPTTTTTTIVEPIYYGYIVNVYACGVCDNIPIQSSIVVKDPHSDLLINRYYADSITGYVFKIMDSGQLIGGQISNMVGKGASSCKYVQCI